MNIFVWVLESLLVVVALRRLIWVAAALLPARQHGQGYLPSVCALVAVHNEEQQVADLLKHLEQLQYPADRLVIRIIDDASNDRTVEIVSTWVDHQTNARIKCLSENVGKAEALNQGIADSGDTKIIAVFDADVRPRRNYLYELVQPFTDHTIAAACGYMNPIPKDENKVSVYSSLEYWVNQFVTMAAKDRLGWNPPMLGGVCAYRSTALQEVGRFPASALSEDTEVSLALIANGWKTRFIRSAVSDFHPVTSFRHFLDQRERWTRGLFYATRQAKGLESVVVALGYLDRLLLLALFMAILAGWMHLLWLLAYFLPAIASVAVGLFFARPRLATLVSVLVSIFPMFCVDVWISLTASIMALTKRSYKRLTRSEVEASL